MKLKKLAIYLNGEKSQDYIAVKSLGIESSSLSDLEKYSSSLLVADGGLRHISSGFNRFDCLIWFGDGDSVGDCLHVNSVSKKNRREFSTDKNYSDFGSILDFLKNDEKEVKQHLFAEVVGGLGGDPQHEFANILETFAFVSSLPCSSIFIFHPRIVISSADFAFKTSKGKRFSIFTFEKLSSPIHISHAQYCGGITLLRGSHGLNNIATGEEVNIETRSGTVVAFL